MNKIKFLADVNLEETFSIFIRDLGYDIKKISDIDCFMSDEEIIYFGIQEERIIITEDKDFGEKIYKDKIYCYGIILIRVSSKVLTSKKKRLRNLYELLEFNKGKIVNYFNVISEKKIRTKEL